MQNKISKKCEICKIANAQPKIVTAAGLFYGFFFV